MTFELDRSNNGQYYFRIVASNSKTLAHSETYVAKSDALHAINLIKREASSAPVVDLT